MVYLLHLLTFLVLNNDQELGTRPILFTKIQLQTYTPPIQENAKLLWESMGSRIVYGCSSELT